MLFSAYLGFNSLVVQFLYGMSVDGMVGILSYVMVVAFITLVLVYTILYIIIKPNFGEYHSFFNQERGVIYVMMIV